MIVGIFKARLQGVMVHIGDGHPWFYPIQTEGFPLQVRKGAGGILG